MAEPMRVTRRMSGARIVRDPGFEVNGAILSSFSRSEQWQAGERYSAPDVPGLAIRLTRTGRPGGHDGKGTRHLRSVRAKLKPVGDD